MFQELIRHICVGAGIKETAQNKVMISEGDYLKNAIRVKTGDYAARHQRALEAIAAGHTSGGAKGDLPPLFLPYYIKVPSASRVSLCRSA